MRSPYLSPSSFFHLSPLPPLSYGMRCLGIPNNKHFHDITIIEDAIALNAKLQEGIEVESFDATVAEEYEDSEGHVLNRKTYEDLARQGLL